LPSKAPACFNCVEAWTQSKSHSCSGYSTLLTDLNQPCSLNLYTIDLDVTLITGDLVDPYIAIRCIDNDLATESRIAPPLDLGTVVQSASRIAGDRGIYKLDVTSIGDV
jgi:hypothetical protein